MTLPQQIITIGMCVLGTMATRFLPFFIFKENKKTPEFISISADFFHLQYSACWSSIV